MRRAPRAVAAVVAVAVALVAVALATGVLSAPPEAAERRAPRPPQAASTGVSGCPPLRQSAGRTIRKRGAVVQNLDVRGPIVIAADDVTLRCVRLRDDTSSDYAIRNTDHRGLVLERVDVSCMGSTTPTGAIGTASYTATRVDVSGCQDGFVAAWDTTIQDSWCHDLLAPPAAPDAHTQCVHVMGYGGPQTVVRRIRILRNHLSPAPRHATAAVIIQSAFGSVDDVLVEGNWLDQGTYTVYSRAVDCCPAPTNVRFRDNHFGRGYEFGLRSFDGDVAWTNNRWSDTGRVIPAPGRRR